MEGTGSQDISFQFNDMGYRATGTIVATIMNSSSMNGSGLVSVRVTLPINNEAPLAPTAAIYPENGATSASTEFRFAWEEGVDPDGDKITYILEYSTDRSTWTTIGDTEGIKSAGYAPSDGSTFQPNTTYYWRVTSWDMFGAKSDPSEIFTFTTGAATDGTWSDGEFRVYQDSPYNDAFTVIVTGDGFTADDMGPGGAWEQMSTRAIEGLFTYVEPYKTYRSYLRIWRVAAISEESGISTKTSGTETPCSTIKNTKFGTMYDNSSSSAWCGLYENAYSGQPGKTIDDAWDIIRPSLPSDFVYENCALVVLMNADVYKGTVNYYMESKRTTGFVCRSTGATGSQTGFENVFVHEIGGHAIGHLADCYMTNSTATLPADRVSSTQEMQSLGWYQNVSLSESREECPWSFIFTAPEYTSFYYVVGMYEGARSYGKGIWRSENSSCMYQNEFYFDAASRWSIVNQLKGKVGETLTWEDFVSKDYDRVNAASGTRTGQTVPYNYVPLPEPTIIHGK